MNETVLTVNGSVVNQHESTSVSDAISNAALRTRTASDACSLSSLPAWMSCRAMA